ncbi:hypothetical protein TNCV_685931, partial [Trichonephila clavipes]
YQFRKELKNPKISGYRVVYKQLINPPSSRVFLKSELKLSVSFGCVMFRRLSSTLVENCAWCDYQSRLINNHSNPDHFILSQFPHAIPKLNPPQPHSNHPIQNSKSPTDHLDISCHMPIHGTHPNPSRTPQRTDHCNCNIPFTQRPPSPTDRPPPSKQHKQQFKCEFLRQIENRMRTKSKPLIYPMRSAANLYLVGVQTTSLGAVVTPNFNHYLAV